MDLKCEGRGIGEQRRRDATERKVSVRSSIFLSLRREREWSNGGEKNTYKTHHQSLRIPNVSEMTCEFEVVDDERSDGRVLKSSLDSEREDSSVAGVGSDDSSGGGVGGVGSEVGEMKRE